MAWTLARSLDQLRGEVNRQWPERSKASDGTKGDDAHAARVSDHNPNAAGVVRAIDITGKGTDKNGEDVPGEWLFQHVIALGRMGFKPLQNHGYVIHNKRAAYASNGWEVVRYKGTSPHDKHVHISVGRLPVQYDSTASWGISGRLTPAPNYSFVQAMLNIVRTAAKKKPIKVDGVLGNETKAAIAEFQRDYNTLPLPDLPLTGGPDAATCRAIGDMVNLIMAAK